MTTTATEDLRRVLEQYPLLTDAGMKYYCCDGHGRGTAEYAESLQSARETMMDRADAFARLCDWLRPMKRTKHVNRNRNSYGIKKLARGDLGEYLSNGLLIAAAVHLGFKIKYDVGDTSVFINISQRALSNTRLERKKRADRRALMY